MRIVIADDHPVLLMGLRTLLEESSDGYRVVGEAHSGTALLALLAKHSCDLVITDFSMPTVGSAPDGLSLIRLLREQYPKLPIIILTMLSNQALIRGMIAAGAHAVIEKTSMAKELILAIQRVRVEHANEGKPSRNKVMKGVVDRRSRAYDTGRPLSSREAEILRMLSRGLKVSEIALATGRSVKTISQQKHDAMRKLGIDNDRQLFEYMRMHGL